MENHAHHNPMILKGMNYPPAHSGFYKLNSQRVVVLKGGNAGLKA